MKKSSGIPSTLALALGIGSWIVASPAAMADEVVQQTPPIVQVQQSPQAAQAQPSTAATQAQQSPQSAQAQPSTGATQAQQAPVGLQTQQTAPAAQARQCDSTQPGDRIRVTGSNISRPRSGCGSLPLLTLDRGYIDQSSATNTSELLRSVPQIGGTVPGSR